MINGCFIFTWKEISLINGCDFTVADHKMSSAMMMTSAPAAICATIATEGKQEEGDGSANQGVNSGEDEKREPGPPGAAAASANGFQER